MTTLKDLISLNPPSGMKEKAIPEAQDLDYDSKARVDASQGERTLKLIKERFAKSSHIYIIFSKAIGDSIISTAFIKGLTQIILQKTKITLVVAPYLQELFLPLTTSLGVEITSDETTFDINSLVFELRFQTGMPYIEEQNPKSSLIVHDLFGPLVGLYKSNLYGVDRFKLFLKDLFSLAEIDLTEVIPTVILPPNSETIYQELVNKFNIDTNLLQISIVIEASTPEKRYSLENWQKVIKGLKVNYPNSEVNILFNDDPSKGTYKKTQLEKAFDGISDLRLISTTIARQAVLLSRQKLVLSNDTGFANLAAALRNGPKVISLHLPQFPPKIWLTDQNRHFGIVADGSSVDSISPNHVVNKAIEVSF